MRKCLILLSIIAIVLVGCKENAAKNDITSSSSKNFYAETWDGNSIVVKQMINEESYKTINVITDTAVVKELVDELRGADWQENVELDIRPPDYYFSWNGFEHNVWLNETTKRLELSVEGKSNYGKLSEHSSSIVLELLMK